jgi:putative endonuclease
MFYVYVLRSKKDSRFYIGFTPDLRLRFQEHNDGKVRSTSYRRPLELIYYEAYKDEQIARKRERQLKGGKAHMSLKKRLTEKR